MSCTDTYSSAENALTRQAVIAAAREIGAAAVSWTSRTVVRDVAHLRVWQSLGLHGEMKFMARKLNASPAGLLSQERESGETGRNEGVSEATTLPNSPALIVISLIFPYVGAPALLRIGAKATGAGKLAPGLGRIARYATGPDYHHVLPLKLANFIERLQRYPAGKMHRWKSFADAVPTLERAWAKNSKVGFQGKNTMVIRPGVGSFFFIAEVVTTASIDGVGEELQAESGCGTCHRCAAGCPTAALETPYRLDARRCISYLTIEKRGVLAEWERRALGEWLFGCDICQEVCPFNHNPMSALEEFSVQKVGETASIKEILKLRTAGDFERFCGGTPLERTRRAGLVRNALCVAANREEYDIFEDVVELVRVDASPTVRATAVWAAAQLALGSNEQQRFNAALNFALRDADEGVRAEAARRASSSWSREASAP